MIQVYDEYDDVDYLCKQHDPVLYYAIQDYYAHSTLWSWLRTNQLRAATLRFMVMCNVSRYELRN